MKDSLAPFKGVNAIPCPLGMDIESYSASLKIYTHSISHRAMMVNGILSYSCKADLVLYFAADYGVDLAGKAPLSKTRLHAVSRL